MKAAFLRCFTSARVKLSGRLCGACAAGRAAVSLKEKAVAGAIEHQVALDATDVYVDIHLDELGFKVERPAVIERVTEANLVGWAETAFFDRKLLLRVTCRSRSNLPLARHRA